MMQMDCMTDGFDNHFKEVSLWLLILEAQMPANIDKDKYKKFFLAYDNMCKESQANLYVMIVFCFLFVLSMHYLHQSSKWVLPLQFSIAIIYVINSFSLYISPYMKLNAKQKAPSVSISKNICICSVKRSAAAAGLDIKPQTLCIRYPAWISDTRNNFCQHNRHVFLWLKYKGLSINRASFVYMLHSVMKWGVVTFIFITGG